MASERNLVDLFGLIAIEILYYAASNWLNGKLFLPMVDFKSKLVGILGLLKQDFRSWLV